MTDKGNALCNMLARLAQEDIYDPDRLALVLLGGSQTLLDTPEVGGGGLPANRFRDSEPLGLRDTRGVQGGSEEVEPGGGKLSK